MEKLPMCRLCLAENVRMYVVVNKDLHELYERLTDNPFVTGDSRPMLACFICCTKLKQCCQLQRKCLEAEELLTQMMNEDCELNPPTNQHRFGCFNGLIISPMVYVSIDSGDECQAESITVKEELPAVCERLDDVIEPEEEHQSDELELENLNKSYSEDIPAQQSDSEDDVPLIEIKTDVKEEQEVSRKKRRASETTRAAVAKKPKLYIQGKKPEDAITENLKKNEKSDTKITQNTQKWTPVAKISRLQPRRTKLEEVIREEQRTELSDTEVVWTSENCTSKPDPNFEEPSTCTLPRVDNSMQNNSLATNCHKEYIKSKISNQCVDSDDIKKNQRLCVKDKRFKCDICPSSFRAMAYLTGHIRTHTGEKPFKCEVCQRCFSMNANLKKHIRTHTGEKPFECDICQRCFGQKDVLKSHIRTHIHEKSYKCDICQRCFRRNSHLTSHIRTHTGEKPFKCDICMRSFSQKTHLKSHIRAHTGEKPFKCNICQRSFSQKAHLSIHIRVHTGEKPFKCDICQRFFAEKVHLKSHMRVHTGEHPFKCDICQKCFAHKSHLTSHNRTHTGEKPFKCDICQRCFTERNHLKQHMRTHTGEKPFKCDICQRCFSQKCDLSRHIRTHT